MAQTVVVLEHDPNLARSIAGELRPHFSVHLARTREELRDNVMQNRPEAIVLNIEASHLGEVASLHQDFPELSIVCTHRIPDEEMWTAALEAGATDVCPVHDVRNVLTSVLRHTRSTGSAAA